jgi:uridine kinase
MKDYNNPMTNPVQFKRKPIVIGIAGGSGSGKTTVANEILNKVGAHQIAFLPHDAYYRELGHLPQVQREQVNFDHPNSMETELLIDHVKSLLDGHSIEMPVYDFTTHSRTGKSIHVDPRNIIMVEGILIFAEPVLRDLFDVKIFVDTDADIRFMRRLERDIAERGRTVSSVIKQYQATVRPMHLEFVEPSKRYADVIIPEGGRNWVALDMVIAKLETLL